MAPPLYGKITMHEEELHLKQQIQQQQPPLLDLLLQGDLILTISLLDHSFIIQWLINIVHVWGPQLHIYNAFLLLLFVLIVIIVFKLLVYCLSLFTIIVFRAWALTSEPHPNIFSNNNSDGCWQLLIRFSGRSEAFRNYKKLSSFYFCSLVPCYYCIDTSSEAMDSFY